MDEIWAVLEQYKGELDDISWEIVAQGREIGDKLNQRLCAVIMGSNISSLIDSLNHRGIDEAYLLDDPNLGTYLPELHAQALSKFIQERGPRIVLWAATPNGSDLAARIAARLGLGLVSDCIAFEVGEEGSLLHYKPTHKEKVCSKVISPHARPQLATVRPGSAEVKDLYSTKEVKITTISPQLDPSKCAIRATGVIKTDPVSLPVEEADIIVSGGGGVGSKDNFRLVEEAASALGGTIGASRIAIDNRWVPRERQIGQSGRTVKPQLYIACGISGASHHIMGMKDSEFIVAINTDPHAHIFRLADVGIIGDLFQVLPAITNEIRKRKGATEAK
jgi:electron transfer flavoprotein alpha subunit